MTHDEFAWFIAQSDWIFAKTMPHIPHEYTLRKKASDETVFEAAVMFIREHGYVGQWGRFRRMYYDVDGRQYWTMGAAPEETILINRAELGGSSEAKRV